MKRKVVIVGSILLLIIIVTSSTSLSDNPSMPSELNVYVSDNTPNVGDTVKVTISEIPYEDRGEMQFSADVYYGAKASHWNEPDYILSHWTDPDYPSGWMYNLEEGVTYTTSFSFIPEKDGKVTIDISCHRRYDITTKSIEINVLEKADSGENSTPGFELTSIVCMIALLILWKRRGSRYEK